MKKNITITINANVATEFQETLLNKILQTLLDALKINMESFHKENKISYEIDTNDGYKTIKL
jgi:hypothetical protein